ncbi:MAG: hypothetical protein Q8939_04960 [Bacteroidota bacterium]|nr:hypothetical protein [Bacteroidota bacterium]MDP4214215.1 hypothetical protein [Bacteroidota bacterium]
MKSQLLIQEQIKRGKYNTPDPYDVWNMKIGQWVKKIYYKSKLLGLLPAAALTLYDFYINNRLRFGYSPRQYPIAHGYRVMIALNLYKKTSDPEYLASAKESLEWLSKNYSRNYSGYCWGINMPWVSKIATYEEEVPHVTHTPYALEAFLKYQELTKTTEYDKIIDSILQFLDNDLNKLIDSGDTLALSYSPKTEVRVVVNANSYAMSCYASLYGRNPDLNAHIEDKIKKLYHFLVTTQHENGSWYYFADDGPGNLIDCFHSCIVLKNIYKVNRIIPLPGSGQVIEKGYAYLKQYFWNDTKKLFKRFSITDRLSLIKFDLYDNAEMLNLAVLLKDDALVDTLSASIEKNFVVDTDVYSHIIFPNLKINKNTLRWATYPYLYALSKII